MIKSATKILSSSLGNSNNKRWWLGGNLLPILHANLILLSTDGSLEKDSTGCPTGCPIIFFFFFRWLTVLAGIVHTEAFLIQSCSTL
jgi:hypothetical protein